MPEKWDPFISPRERTKTCSHPALAAALARNRPIAIGPTDRQCVASHLAPYGVRESSLALSQYLPGSTATALVQVWDTTSYEEMTHLLGWVLSNLRIRDHRVSWTIR